MRVLHFFFIVWLLAAAGFASHIKFKGKETTTKQQETRATLSKMKESMWQIWGNDTMMCFEEGGNCFDICPPWEKEVATCAENVLKCCQPKEKKKKLKKKVKE